MIWNWILFEIGLDFYDLGFDCYDAGFDAYELGLAFFMVRGWRVL